MLKRRSPVSSGNCSAESVSSTHGATGFNLVYLFMILALIYIVDEIASTISIQFQTNIVQEFFRAEHGHGIRRRTFVVVRFGLYHLSRHGR